MSSKPIAPLDLIVADSLLSEEERASRQTVRTYLEAEVEVNPAVVVGTTNPRIPSSVLAHTTATSATVPLVIHILEPLSTQSEPSRLAKVRMPAGSEPKSASVRPKQPTARPLAS